jgi:hypothetical protein
MRLMTGELLAREEAAQRQKSQFSLRGGEQVAVERGLKVVRDLDVTDCGSVGRSERLGMSAEIEAAVMGLVRRRSMEFMTTLE